MIAVQHDLERDIDQHREEQRLHRRPGVAARQKRDRGAAHQHERQEPDRIGLQRGAGRRRVGGGEGAAHEQRAHDQVRQQQERDQARDRQQQRELDRAVLGVARAGLVAARQPVGHLRQQHGADRDADHADRQLIEPVGVVKRRQRAGGEEARDDGVGEQRDLGLGRADGGGPEPLEEQLHLLVEPRPAERRQHALPRGVGGEQRHLEAAGDEHAPGRRVTRGRKEERQRERRDHREVEQDRRRRGRRKAAERIEDAAVERHQRDQQQIGKGDARELDREREALAVVREARRQHRDHRRREDQRDREQHRLHDEQQREDAVGEQLRRVGAGLLADARIGGHEGGVERAFGEDRAEMIGQPQRHEEGVGDRARAEDGRQHDVAHKAGDARQQREAADREDASDHRAQCPGNPNRIIGHRAGPAHAGGRQASSAETGCLPAPTRIYTYKYMQKPEFPV